MIYHYIQNTKATKEPLDEEGHNNEKEMNTTNEDVSDMVSDLVKDKGNIQPSEATEDTTKINI